MILLLRVWWAAGIGWAGCGQGKGGGGWCSGSWSFGISAAASLMSGISGSSCGSARGTIVSCDDGLVTAVNGQLHGASRQFVRPLPSGSE